MTTKTKTAKIKKTHFIFKIAKEEEEKLLSSLVKYGSVKIGKFGIFELRHIASREGWNVKKKEKKTTKPYIKISFRALKKSKDYVNQVDTTK